MKPNCYVEASTSYVACRWRYRTVRKEVKSLDDIEKPLKRRGSLDNIDVGEE